MKLPYGLGTSTTQDPNTPPLVTCPLWETQKEDQEVGSFDINQRAACLISSITPRTVFPTGRKSTRACRKRCRLVGPTRR